MTDDADEAAAVDLLRRLAGRIPDGTLRSFRSQLAAWAWDRLTGSLARYLARERIALDAAERALLDQIAGPGAAAKVPDSAGDPPAYRFSADGPEPAAAEQWLEGAVSSLPVARRLSAAYRTPANEAALPLATWVYLVELDLGADVAHVQDQLRVGSPDRGVVEVYAAGDDLPPYQAAALSVARLIWSHSPD